MEYGNCLKRGCKRSWDSSIRECNGAKKNLAQNRMRALQSKLKSETEVASNIKKHSSEESTANNNKYLPQIYSSPFKHSNGSSSSTRPDNEKFSSPVPSKRVAHRDLRCHRLGRNNSFEKEELKSSASVNSFKRCEKQQKPIASVKKSMNSRLNKIRQQAICNTSSSSSSNSNNTTGVTTKPNSEINVFESFRFNLQDISKNSTGLEPILFKESDENINELQQHEDILMDWNTVSIERLEVSEETSNESEYAFSSPSVKKQNIICIVPDTNIFINNLNIMADVINYKGSQQIEVHIPWMVIKELEQFKDDARTRQTLKEATMRAEKFINNHLKMPESKVFGQSSEEFVNQKDIGVSPDDKILACCIQLWEKFDPVILLTGDVNLSNKALINNIEVCSPREIILTLHTKTKKNIGSLKVSQKMSKLLSQIISECCKEAYNDVWNQMHLLQSPPWSLFDCLKILKKYWISVFQRKLLKHTLNPIDKLYEILLINKENICDDSEIFRDFADQAKTVLIFLRDISEYKALVQKTLTEVQALTSR